ncbi:MAG: hypothetical protein ABIK65_15650 [Candidatus Eisenbacteria bacterium]
MPCPHIILADRSAPPVRVYLCTNPVRGEGPRAPRLAQLREHCLTEDRYERCDGYREAKRRTRDSRH